MDCSKETLRAIYGIEKINLEDKKSLEVFKEISTNPDGYRKKVLELYMQKEQTDCETCSKCGGECCKNAPCHYSPNDFGKITYRRLKKYIDRGNISIVYVRTHEDEFENRSEIYILRVRGENRPISDFVGRENITCSMLTDKGCEFSYDERPLGGKMMIARKNMQCFSVYDSEMCFKDWLPYQRILKKLFKKYAKI